MKQAVDGKLRRSFAIAGAAVVLPLLAVFAFNTLWGYLPLHRDVGAVPHFVQATNSMRDLEISVLQSSLPVHVYRVSPAGVGTSATTGTADPAKAYEQASSLVKARFATAKQAVQAWPDVLDRTYELYGVWLVLHARGQSLLAPDTSLSGSPQRVRDLQEFDRLTRRLVNGIDVLNQTISTSVSERLENESAHSQRVLGLSLSIGFMVIVFIMYVNLRLARYVVDPVNGLVGSITKFREGDYTARTDVSRADEIGNLADAFNDMAQNIEQTHQHLASLSERDPLTGMLNRRGFDPRFERQLRQAEAGTRDLALIMIDIDHFKSVNDTHGHATGDQVLVAVADTIRNCLRAGDFSARFGGEEFIVCLPDENRDTGLTVAERIREAIARLPLASGEGTAITVTASAGVALYPSCGQECRALIEAGDAALYAAKANGRNRVELAAANDFARKDDFARMDGAQTASVQPVAAPAPAQDASSDADVDAVEAAQDAAMDAAMEQGEPAASRQSVAS